MAQAPAPAKHNHDEPPHAKTVGQSGSFVLPLAEAGGPPLVGATGVTGLHIEDGERDPNTIAEEQRIRSQEYVDAIVNPDTLNPRPAAAAHHLPPKK
jgi:hypothetical protein